MPRLRDLSGVRFSRLVVIEQAGRDSSGGVRWNCACDCGGTYVTSSWSLVDGRARSCGCLYRETRRMGGKKNTVHGKSYDRVHKIWDGMLQRCTNPKQKGFHRYGGRGITVCDRWCSFENFLADMGEPPQGTSLDRINNDGNYEPSNCRWATAEEQANNRRNNRILTMDGRSLTVSQWSRLLKIGEGGIRHRLRSGMSDAQALGMVG